MSSMSLVSSHETAEHIGQKVLKTENPGAVRNTTTPGGIPDWLPQLSDQLMHQSTSDALASMYDDEPTSSGCPEYTDQHDRMWAELDERVERDFGVEHTEASRWTARREDSQYSAQQWKSSGALPGYPQPRGPPGFPARPQRPQMHQHRAGPKEIPEHLKGKRLLGKALWFANKMGFGFIQHEGVDYFVHYTDICMKGWRSLSPDDEVEFELENQGGRIKAVKVTGKGGKQRERPKSEQRAIKLCAQNVKGLCRRGASCRFVHIDAIPQLAQHGHPQMANRGHPMRSQSHRHMPRGYPQMPMRHHSHREIPFAYDPRFC